MQSIDVVKTVTALREDRGGLIETVEEYYYVYKVMSYYAQHIYTMPGLLEFTILENQ